MNASKKAYTHAQLDEIAARIVSSEKRFRDTKLAAWLVRVPRLSQIDWEEKRHRRNGASLDFGFGPHGSAPGFDVRGGYL